MAKSVTYNKHASTFIIIVGVACMVVAGYFLIEGLSQFSGNATTRNILIIGGILFQISESLCFVAAAALAHHSRVWRMSLFSLGCVLFLFSVAVMTLAQKTALQSGINVADAIDEKRQYLRKQLSSLDKMIESYQYNAKKQSKSIYKDSRAMGQDSINRATEIEQQKLDLSNELFALNQERKETSVDFFNRLEEVTGLHARNTEFYFLVLRSLLIELCGILLMAFGASLRAFRTQSRWQVTEETRSFADIGGLCQDETTVASNDSLVESVVSQDVAKMRQSVNQRNGPKFGSSALLSSKSPQVTKALKKSNSKSSIVPNTNSSSFSQADRQEDSDVFDIDAVDLDAEIQFIEDHPKAQKYTEHRYSQHIQRLRESNKGNHSNQDQGNSIIGLYEKGVISSLNRDEIRNGLRKYNNIEVDKALDEQIENFVLNDGETVKP